jgi:hypothetical protein
MSIHLGQARRILAGPAVLVCLILVSPVTNGEADQAGGAAPGEPITQDDDPQTEIPLASPPVPVPDGNAQDAREEKFVVTKAVLKCDVIDILVMTSCIPHEVAYCFRQDVSFVGRGANAATTISYPHPFRKGNEAFVTNVLCLAADRNFYVMLESTNFDNCLTCTWWDVFTHQGKYLGSTQGIIQDGSFASKKLPPALARLLFKASDSMVISISGLHVSRPEPAQEEPAQ